MRLFQRQVTRRSPRSLCVVLPTVMTACLVAFGSLYLSDLSPASAIAEGFTSPTPTQSPTGAWQTITGTLIPVSVPVTATTPTATTKLATSPTSVKAAPSTPTISAKVAPATPTTTRSATPPSPPSWTPVPTTIRTLSARPGQKNPTTISGLIGRYQLAGRATSSGAIITATPGTFTTTVSADGTFTLTIPDGTYTVTALMPGYLPTQKVEVTLVNGGPITLSDAVAVSGDVDASGAIDSSDLTIVGGVFGLGSGAPGFDARADVNGDGLVNIIDLVLAASHFGTSGIQPWP